MVFVTSDNFVFTLTNFFSYTDHKITSTLEMVTLFDFFNIPASFRSVSQNRKKISDCLDHVQLFLMNTNSTAGFTAPFAVKPAIKPAVEFLHM